MLANRYYEITCRQSLVVLNPEGDICMKVIRIIFSLLPIPFLFHYYEYNRHLAKQEAVLLFPGFLLFMIVVGILMRKNKLPLLLTIGMLMTIISLLFGNLFIVDDGSWFKPFGRDVAIIFISIVYILGQSIVRWISRPLSTEKKGKRMD